MFDTPHLHFGAIGAGKMLTKSDDVKREIRAKFNVLGLDCGFQAVLESLKGNRKEDFALIRVACDWSDGLGTRSEQRVAAVRAAAITRLLVSQLPRLQSESDEDD